MTEEEALSLLTEADIDAALVLVKVRILPRHAPSGRTPIAEADQITRLARSAASRVY